MTNEYNNHGNHTECNAMKGNVAAINLVFNDVSENKKINKKERKQY